jgi:polyisoprenoid-binding protein YceI
MKKSLLFFSALCLSAAAVAQTWTLDKGHSKLGFTVIHLGISEVDGNFKTYDAKITASKEDFSDAVFEVSADMNTITTGNDFRDGDLKKPGNFDTEKFPTMTFKSTGISKISDKKFKLTGDLTLKGVTKQVSLDLTIMGTTTNRQNKKLVGVKVSGTIKRSEFGVGGMPTMVVAEDVELRASGEFVAN